LGSIKVPARDHDRTRRLLEPGLAEYDEIWVIGTCLLAASSEDCEALPVLPVLQGRSPGTCTD